MIKFIIFFVVLLCCGLCLVEGGIFEDNITFTVFNNATGKSFNSTFNQTLQSQGCDTSGKFSIVVHGWQESITRGWVPNFISNLTLFRGGCVIFMDYFTFSKNPDYFALVRQFPNISNVLLQKLRQLEKEGVQDDNLFLFGFSYGSRLAFDAGINFGVQRIKYIDACDPAGPGFDNLPISKDPKLSAKNVQCINTSIDKGTTIYNCHQNWRMGSCGYSQIGATSPPFMSHGLCPYFYTSAFKNDFKFKNITTGCYNPRPALKLPLNFKMGYMEMRRNSSIVGDIFANTGMKTPWNVL